MKDRRYATSRQKACLSCSAAKAKCDRKPGRCSRCSSKDLTCAYRSGVSTKTSVPRESTRDEPNLDSSRCSLAENHDGHYTDPDSRGVLCADTQTYGSIPEIVSNVRSSDSPMLEECQSSDSRVVGSGAFSVPSPLRGFTPMDSELCCPIDAEAIRNRWLNVYLPVPGQRPKIYPTYITAFIRRILKSYAANATHGRGVPPFVHASQIDSEAISRPLATCLTLVRMCEKPLPGSESAAVDVLQREMSNIFDQHDNLDSRGSLAVFQAYFIYIMVLFFNFRQDQSLSLREAMMNLQYLASASSRCGLMCVAEKKHTRPRWEAWILMEAKRRTLYTMYLFDSILSAQDGLPTALGTELTGLPAPSNKHLWQAQTREVWEEAYNTHLADLAESLRIDELWPIPEDLDIDGLAARRQRVDLWLQNVDEFGTMLYAVTSCTHGD